MRQPYKTDLTDAQWALVQPLIPPAKPGGRPRSTDIREVLNTLLYQSRTGCQWALLPHDLLPRSTVWEYFVRWNQDGTLGRIVDALRTKVRVAEGRDPTPSTGYIDSQTVKGAEVGGERGFDGGKKLTGRKRHIVVDNLGLLMSVVVTSAAYDDGAIAPMALARLDAERFPRLVRIWGDSKYHNHDLLWWVSWMNKPYQVRAVHRPEGAKGWVKLPKRWVVERSIGWMGRNRRQSRDYERTTGSSEAWIEVGAIGGMLRRMAPAPRWNSAPFKYPKPPIPPPKSPSFSDSLLVLHDNKALNHISFLAGRTFTASTICQACPRFPLFLLRARGVYPIIQRENP